MAGQKGLTEKQKRFIDYYIESGNQTEAARLAGYKQPHVQGAQNFEKLRAYISERNAILEDARICDMREINQFWTSIIRGKEAGADMRDRLKASELRARVQGAFIDRIGLEVTKDIAETIADIEAYVGKQKDG